MDDMKDPGLRSVSLETLVREVREIYTQLMYEISDNDFGNFRWESSISFFDGSDPNNFPYLKSRECLILKKRANLEKMENARLLRLLEEVHYFYDFPERTFAPIRFDWRRPNFCRILHEDAELHCAKTYRTGSRALFSGHSQGQDESWLSPLERACVDAKDEYSDVDSASEGLEDLTDGVTTELLTSDIVDADAFWEDDTLELGTGDTTQCDGRKMSSIVTYLGTGANSMSSIPIGESSLKSFHDIGTESVWPCSAASSTPQRLSYPRKPNSTHTILDKLNHTHGSLFTDNCSCSNPPTDTTTPLRDSAPLYDSDDRPHHDDLCHLYASALSPYTPPLPYQPSRSQFGRLYTTKRYTGILPTLALLSLATPPLVLAHGAARDVILHITAGVSFATSAALPPLRSFDDLAPAYWISLYSVWGAAFLAGFMLALQRRDNWLQRQVLGWMVIFGGINLLGSLSQNVPTQLDAVAVWGPLALTVSLYVISGLSELMSLDRAARLMGNA